MSIVHRLKGFMTQQTPLYSEHVKLGGKIVDFAGWQLPVLYTSLIEEHQAVRQAAGIFDVSHMGQVVFKGPGALDYVQQLTVNDVSKLVDNQAQYSVMCRENGTAIDDIIVYRFNEQHFMFVINGANVDKDYHWIEEHAPHHLEVMDVSSHYALIALQGPQAPQVLRKISAVDLKSMKPFTFTTGTVANEPNCIVATTGYTGEVGCEIFCPPAKASQIWNSLLQAGAKPCGLGARDTLRLEMAYCLYGHELNDETTPLEANLAWVTKLNIAHDFFGKAALKKQAEQGLKRKLTGFELLDKGIAREGYPVLYNNEVVGKVTSGTHSPSLDKSIGLAMVPVELTKPGSKFFVDIRGKQREAVATKTPFYKGAS